MSDNPFQHARLLGASAAETVAITQLYDYVSAYGRSEETLAELRLHVVEAFLRARDKTESQYVSLDGEMEIRVSPSGAVALMLPWKRFEMQVERGMEPARDIGSMPRAEVEALRDALRDRFEEERRRSAERIAAMGIPPVPPVPLAPASPIPPVPPPHLVVKP